MKITFTPIGVIHSPFTCLEDMPIQPSGSLSAQGSLEIYPEFIPALHDLDGFSHLYAIYFFHKSAGWKSAIIPFLDTVERGLFSTRAPRRPNPIGLSVLEIVQISEGNVTVNNVDILDGTPLLDIKPYVPQFEPLEQVRIGWLADHIKDVKHKKSDQRFKE